jgi:hypothetical protein
MEALIRLANACFGAGAATWDLVDAMRRLLECLAAAAPACVRCERQRFRVAALYTEPVDLVFAMHMPLLLAVYDRERTQVRRATPLSAEVPCREGDKRCESG